MPAEYKKAQVVEQMVRYLPFDARAGNLFEEHVTEEDAPDPYETRTLSFIRDLLSDQDVSLIVLTGDAGHGKTHLCRRILERSGVTASDAVRMLKEDPRGERPIDLPDSDKPIRLIKDLSEFTEGEGAEILAAMLKDSGAIGIASANEGRLRSVVSRDPDRLSILLDALEAGIRRGATTADGSVHVVNLNYQAVTPPGGGFLLHLLDSWARDGRRWKSCTQCAASSECPIYRNKEYLGERTADAERRRDGFTQLVRTAEQTGYVFTIREALILTAYLVTGGLTCEVVHELHRKRASRQLQDHDLSRLMFDRPLSDRESKQLGVLERIRRYDPGRIPHRDVDEEAVRTLEDNDQLGVEAWFGSAGTAQSRRQRRDEARQLRQQVRTERRHSFFERPKPGRAGMLDRARRIGLYHYPKFDHVQGGEEDPKWMRDVIESVIQGLHVIQGIRPSDRSHLYLVDPAFSRSGSHTSVIALRIPKRELWLSGLHDYWQRTAPETRAQLVNAVDWLDRSICLCRGEGDSVEEVLSLDLLQFEFVLRSAEGVSFSRFHAADRRRILSKLAKIAEAEEAADEEIRFVMSHALMRVVVERDGTIEVHGGD